jgi:phosphatidylglycerophosphatase A
VPENPALPSSAAPPLPPPGPEPGSSRLRRLFGLGPKVPKPPPGPPLVGAAAGAVKVLGSFFGAGFLPLAPGTWGSLAALAIWLAGRELGARFGLSTGKLDWLCLLASAGCFAATLALGKLAERAAGRGDPRWFVLDELGGAFLALWGLAGYNDRPGFQLVLVAGAFLLFRLLDATKLGPIGWVDRRLTGGLGMLLDDLLAGAFANLAVRGAALLLVGKPLAGG